MHHIYYKNGLIFLSKKVYGDVQEPHLREIEKRSEDDSFIAQHILDAPIEYLGGKNVSIDIDMNALNIKLGRTGYSTAKNVPGSPADLFKKIDEKGFCSCCGKEGLVKSNTATIFPLESEWGKSGLCLVPPERRLRFCKSCAFLIYSGMAGVYWTHSNKKRLRAIFDADPDALNYLWAEFKDASRDENDLNSVRLKLIPYDGHEMLLFLIYEFMRSLLRMDFGNAVSNVFGSPDDGGVVAKEGVGIGVLVEEGTVGIGAERVRDGCGAEKEGMGLESEKEAPPVLRRVDMHYVLSGEKIRDDVGVVEGEVLYGLAKFFSMLEDAAKKGGWMSDETGRTPSPFEVFMWTSVTSSRKSNLRKRKTGADGSSYKMIDSLVRYRNSVCRGFLNRKVDFEAISQIAFERQKLGERNPVPAYYGIIVTKYMEAFGMEKELENYRRLNAFGYSLGKEVKGTNQESFVWEIFRARGFEDLLNALSELQLKLGTRQNWDPIYDTKDEWKTAKAIILNGMMNAIAEKKEVS